MAMENWITGREMLAISMIVREMPKEDLGETGGDVLRIPMAKLKKAGYTFCGCDIASDYKDLPELRASFKKIDMNAQDTEESINLLAKSLAKVMAALHRKKKPAKKLTKKPAKPITLRELGY